ncbi:NAD(P)H-binding protein [Myxococcus sp. K15C18031901]|uniref:SDR family oxidoreductase n=1 Tax=Myxococcus dinghuensis TaxID=2906761 RepID=UPI0020A73E7D|nr:NAD(P)H-binding protein [Myxococcus dinghuensis]MCP3097924.1 NAD(P)H-binding protein [Myxococcus dinghuensis]
MIVVIGATGNVGRELVQLLAEAGEEVVAVSRHPGAPVTSSKVRPVQGDVSAPETLVPHLRGAAGVFLLVPGGGMGLDARALRTVFEAAGVTRLVVLSSLAVGTRPSAPSHAPLRDLEAVFRASSLRCTFLRPGGFASNALAWVGSVRTERGIAAPFADVALPVVDPADIAAVAARVLLEEGHAGKVYELTGPVAISPRQQAAVISEALGAPLRFMEWSREEALAMMRRFMPEPVAEGTLDILGTPTDDERRISPDVERVLGRPANPFSAWVGRNVAAFR